MSKKNQIIGSEFYPEIEYQSWDDIKIFQEQKLRETIAYVAKNSPFYEKKFIEWGIKPEDIKTLADLQKIPRTTKEDLNKFNFDFCVFLEKK